MILKIKQLFSIFQILPLIVLYSCIGVDKVDDLVDKEPKLIISSFSQKTGKIDTVNIGDSISLIATYTDNAQNESIASATWESSDEAIATIDKGLLIAKSGGHVTITATANGVSDQILLFIQELNRIEISSSSKSSKVGDSIQFAAEYFDASGILTPSIFSWTSSNASVATIDDNGLLKAIATGQTQIQATTNDTKSASVLITVVENENAIAAINISGASSVEIGKTTQLTAEAYNVNGQLLNTPSFSWTSDNISILEIDDSGIVVPISIGVTTVQAHSENVSSSPYEVIITRAEVTERTGRFVSPTSSYTVTGDVTVSEKSDGSLELSVASNFSTSNGPGIYFYFGNSQNLGSLEIEPITTSMLMGPYSVSIPDGIAIDDFDYVLVWCDPFGVAFGYAKLN